jgi:HPt (histidine-containing phosphotransfer) domain-containing protein
MIMKTSSHKNDATTSSVHLVAVSMDFSPELINVAYLREISGDNRDFIQSILSMFKEESEDFIGKMRNHFRQKDFYSLKKAAHAMKPTGSYIGVDALTLLITSLEKAAPSGDMVEVGGLISEIERLVRKLHVEIDRCLISI